MIVKGVLARGENSEGSFGVLEDAGGALEVLSGF